jgi:hypothetical protein
MGYQRQFQVLPTCSVGNEGRKEFIIVIYKDNGNWAKAGPAQPCISYVALPFEGNALAGFEGDGPPERWRAQRDFSPMTTNLCQIGWRVNSSKWWALRVWYQEVYENFGYDFVRQRQDRVSV